MSTDLLSLILDFAVLLALGGTIYFALRLSSGLENFRNSRNELKGLIEELTQNIDQAQTSVDNLKKASNNAATDLEDVLHDSKRMADELKMINEASNNLANRMEGLAEKNRKAAPKAQPETFENEDYIDDDEDLKAMSDNIETPSFFIQDKEFDNDDQPDEFSSQAERELYEALKKNKKRSGGA